MDKIDSNDQLFTNIKNNKLILHVFAILTLLFMNNIKQFEFLSFTNFFKGIPETTPNPEDDVDKEITSVPEFLNTKSSVVAVIASLLLLLYIRIMGKTITSYILKNELWNNDTGIYSILNIPISITSFVIVTISIMMILRLIHYHVGGVYLESNTYSNQYYKIYLREGDKINSNSDNLKIINTNDNNEIIVNRNIIPSNNDYVVDRLGSIIYENKIIWKLNNVPDSSRINKIKFLGDKMLFLNNDDEEIDQIILNTYINDTNNLYFHLTENGNLMLLKGLINNNNEYIIDNISNTDASKIKLLWQSGGDIKPNEDINHILTASSNEKIINFDENESDDNFILRSKNGTYSLFGKTINGRRCLYVKKYNENIIWLKDIHDFTNDNDSISINENMNLVSSNSSIIIPDRVKFLELKNDGNLVAYNFKEESIWMTRKGLFNGKGLLNMTLPYLGYAAIFYLIESVLVRQKWYIGFIRKFIRIVYLGGGFIFFSLTNGISTNNFIQLFFMFFFLLYFIFWKTKDFVKDSNHKNIVYFISFAMFSLIYLIFNLVRKISIFPIDINNWSHSVDDIECNTNIFEIFTNPTFRHQPSRYIFFVIAILLFLPLLLFAVNKPSLFTDKTSSLKDSIGSFFTNKSFSLIFGLWIIFNLLFAIIPNAVNNKKTFEANLIYANYHKIVSFISIIVVFMFLLIKTFTNTNNQNNYYNVLIVLITLFIINKFIEYPSISFYYDQKKSKEKHYNLSTNLIAKNNFIRILVLFISFLFISYNIFNDPNSTMKSKLSILFLVFCGFFTTILGLVYQHLFYNLKEPRIQLTDGGEEINYINWNSNYNNICGKSENFKCKQIPNLLLRLRDYSVRLPLLISIIAVIIYNIFKNNENVFYINITLIAVLFSFISGVNFAESGNLFNVNIFGIKQDYDILSSPLFSFFISFANKGYLQGGIATTIIMILIAVYSSLKSASTDKTKKLLKNLFIVLLLSLFIAPIITSIILTFKNNSLNDNDDLFDVTKRILNNKVNNSNIDSFKIFSFIMPLIITTLSFLILIYKSTKIESFVGSKILNYLIVTGIIIISFIYGRYIGVMNTNPSDIDTGLKNQIKNTKQIEQRLKNDFQSINNQLQDNESKWRNDGRLKEDITPIIINKDNVNDFFYIYFHGIDVINNLIIANNDDNITKSLKDTKNRENIKKFIPSIYRVKINLDGITELHQLYKEINDKLQKMRIWYLKKYDVDINIKLINETNETNKSTFYLYNYEFEEVIVNDNSEGGIVIKNGIKYKGKYLSEYSGLNNYFGVLKKLTTKYNIDVDPISLNSNNYLNLFYDNFSVIFDSNQNILGNTNINNSSKILTKLADENLKSIFDLDTEFQEVVTLCNGNTNREFNWRNIYDFYYTNRKYDNNNTISRKDKGSSNLKQLIGFGDVNYSIREESKYKGYSNDLNANPVKNQKETFISKVVGNEIRDYDSIEYGSKSNNEICTDAFTDYNYNFKL